MAPESDEAKMCAIKVINRRFGRRLIAFGAAVILLAGCSGFKLAYNFADYQLSQEARFYLDVGDNEAELLDRQIAALLDWHRTRMLPQYAAYFYAQADLVEQAGVNRGQIAQAVQQLRLLMDETFQGASPFFADVLVRHSTEDRVRFLKARMDERESERREEEQAPLDERITDRTKRIVKNFERFMGDLTPDQTARIRTHAKDSIDDSRAWKENRVKRQTAFLDYLSQRPDKSLLSEFIFKITVRSYEIVDPDYRVISERRWGRFESLLGDITLSLSAEQRRTFAENLRGYAADMLDLSS